MTERLVLGADIGGTAVKYVVGGAEDPDRFAGEVRTDTGDVRETFDRLAAAVVDRLPSGAGLAAAGLACAGIVDPIRGTLGRAPNLPGWENRDLAAALREAFGDILGIFANDVNAALAGEARFGAGRGCRDLVMLALGTGVGGAVMVDGRLVTGVHHGAGEIGHMVLDQDGPLCGCGNRGCVEAYAGSYGLLAEARRLAVDPGSGAALSDLVAARGEALSTRDLSDLAAAGDADAAALFARTGHMLGLAVGNLLNLLDPDKIIIGGGVAQAGDLLLAPCRETAASTVLCVASRATPIEPAELGPLAAALGASRLARDGLEAA
ncbi:ROK family protein [bacterium]|nr:ROK family protein [bacterium]